MSAQEKAQNYLAVIDRELSKYPALNNLEKQLGFPKAYAVVGAVALYFFLIIFNIGGQLLTNFAGFVLPGYYSLGALFSKNTEDDTQWLTYWVVFSFFTVLEGFFSIVYWFPFYFVFKFIFLLWLSLPTFRGADIVFRNFLAPTLGRYFQAGSTASGLRSKTDAHKETRLSTVPLSSIGVPRHQPHTRRRSFELQGQLNSGCPSGHVSGMQLSPLQSRLAASLAASLVILALYLLLFSPSAALAAELSTPQNFVATILDEAFGTDDEFDGGYESEFGLFDRTIIGRAPVGVAVLQNNGPQALNLQPGSSVCYMFEKSTIFGNSQGNSRRNAEAGKKDDEDDGDDGAPPSSSAVPSRTVYLSANTCLQPQRIPPNSTSPGPPQLSLYVSNSTQPGCAPSPQSVPGFRAKAFEQGAVMWSFNATGDIFISITAPSLPAGFQGIYNFEVAASTDDYYHQYDSAGGELLWMDSDSSSALLVTKNLTDTVFEIDEIMQKGPQFELYVEDATTPTINGLLHSMCGLKNTARIASKRLDNGEFNNNDMARTKMTIKGPGSWPKQQFYFDGLNSSTSYTGVLFKPANKTDTPKRQASSAGQVGGGGIVYTGTDFQTSAGTNCRVITDLDFCTEVQWAAPGNNKLNNSELAKVYDDYAKMMYANFEKVMMQIPCEAPSTQQYSLARNCDDCVQAYKRWLCTVSIPRCEDFSKQDDFTMIRNAGQPFPNGTKLPDDLLKVLEKKPAWNASRNSFIDEQIAPGPYKEILPCEDVCYEVVQSCPAAIGFTCPRPHMVSFNVSYGRRDGDGAVVQCNYPGEPRTRISAAEIALPNGHLILGTICLLLAMLL
ncbi:Protein yop-1 [Cladobotryum mycophilum]|uniref:Protein yop-1 n=1 Tax=Cladobotryum mycophilum TaxID=491253 RepID=A0ABR0SM16_9HYPO